MFHICFCCAVLSVLCILVVTCLEKVAFFGLLCFVFLVVLFSIWFPGSDVILDCIDS